MPNNEKKTEALAIIFAYIASEAVKNGLHNLDKSIDSINFSKAGNDWVILNLHDRNMWISLAKKCGTHTNMWQKLSKFLLHQE